MYFAVVTSPLLAIECDLPALRGLAILVVRITCPVHRENGL